MKKFRVEKEISNIAVCYQEAIIDTLLEKIKIAYKSNKVNDIMIVGGVSANQRFRCKAQTLMDANIIFPNIEYCTDNAAMIANYANYMFLDNQFSSYDIVPDPRLKF